MTSRPQLRTALTVTALLAALTTTAGPAAATPATAGRAAPAAPAAGPTTAAPTGTPPASDTPAGPSSSPTPPATPAPSSSAASEARAAAAPPDPALLEAVTEQVEDELYSKVKHPVYRGADVHAPLGVISSQQAPVRGLVAQVEAYGDLEFTRHYSNCWYTTGPDGPMAWCEFDATLAGHGGLTLAAPMLSVQQDAVAERIHGIPFRWQSKSWADSRGGLRKVIDFFKSPGAKVVRGTDGKVGLQKRALPMADIRANGNIALLKLMDGPAPIPSNSPTAEPGGGGGGLPVTGDRSAALAGAGLFLLVGGLGALLITRRRRHLY